MIANVPSQDEIAEARADIDQRTEQLVSKGKWDVKGYKVSTDILYLNLYPHSATNNTAITGEVWRPVGTIIHQKRFAFPLPCPSTVHIAV